MIEKNIIFGVKMYFLIRNCLKSLIILILKDENCLNFVYDERKNVDYS